MIGARQRLKLLIALGGAAAGLRGQARRYRMKVVISADVVGEINENDAKAAMKVWVQMATLHTDFDIEPDYPKIVAGEEIPRLARSGQVDALALSVRDFEKAGTGLLPEPIIVDESSLKGQWSYLILTHADSGIRDVDDLKGRSLIAWNSPRLMLRTEWLATLLAGRKLGAPETHFGRIAYSPRLSRGVVLPVFFRQADSCLVAAQGYEAMCEMNPQLKQKLRVLASSPSYVTNFMVFHKNCPPAAKASLTKALANLHNTMEGKQALTLYQSSKLIPADLSVVKDALDLMASYARLKGRAGGVRS